MRRRSETRPAPAEGELGLKLGSEAAASGARALWGVLAVLVLARGALSFVPNMWCWGLNLQRFVPVGPGWGLWALAALALVPAISQPLAAKLKQSSGARKGGGLRFLDIAWGWGLASAAGVWLAPDRVYFVGDFLLRLGTTRLQMTTERVFPQAFPLDVFLHQTVPDFLATKFGLDVLDAERLLGAFEAGAFAMLAVTFVRGLGLAGIATFAATAVVVFGGYLGMFTGYGKAFKEMCVLTAAIGAFGSRVVIQGTGLLPLGLATAIGFALHRSALAFLAPLAVAWWVWCRDHGRLGTWRRPAVVAALALPLVTLGVMAPRMAAVIRSVDRIHVVPGIDPSQALPAAFQPNHLADVANLLVVLSPVAVALPFMALWLGPPLWRRRDLWVLIALAFPFVGAMLFIHPRQGVFRDWDVFAAGGVALSLLAAWMIGEALQAARRLAWIGVAAALGSLAPTAQWLIHHRDVDRGIARVEAFLYEAPPRSIEPRAAAFHYLGRRLAELKRFDASAEAFARAAELGPSSTTLFEWAVAETHRGNMAKAKAIYRQVVDKVPTWFEAWLNLAALSYRRGELVVARQEAERALSIRPRDQAAKHLLQTIERAQAAAAPAAPR